MRPYLCVGTVVKPQGVKGEIKVMPQTDDPARFDKLKRVFLLQNGEYAEHRVLCARCPDGFAYLLLEGVADRDAAEKLRGAELFVPREEAVKLPRGRYYIADLVGCAVLDRQGRVLGRLGEVLQKPGADVYVVSGERGFMFPALRDVLVKIDVEGGTIVLDEERLAEVAVYDEG